MKTADRENPIHGATWPRNRARGALGQNRTSSIEWAEKQEKFQPQEKCFFLTSALIELIRTQRRIVEDASILVIFFLSLAAQPGRSRAVVLLRTCPDDQ